MAFGSFLRCKVLPLLLSVAVSACTADSFVPPAGIDSGTRVGSVVPLNQPRAPVPAASLQSQPAYPVAAPVSNVRQSADYLDTPNLAAAGNEAPGGQRMPTGLNTSMGVQPLRVPSEGVNMDAELGAEPVTGLAEEESRQIAEGNSSQPVVDGIGTDNPTQMNARALPQAGIRAPAGQAQVWSDGSRVIAPTRVPEENEQQVAMLMPNNPADAPMSTPIPPQPGVMPADEISCRRELKRLGVVFTDKPAIYDGPSCSVPYPVSLKGLSGNIGVQPAVTLNCQVTLAFAKWVKNELAPSARYRYWSGIKTIEPLGGYSCRRMNNSRQKYNPMSEHAHGNAIDVGKFTLKNGHQIDIRKKGLFSFREGRLLKAVRSDSCNYFTTVLGPGSNPEHWNHFHFDLRSRKSGRAYCD